MDEPVSTSATRRLRVGVLEAAGATPAVRDELLAYNENLFDLRPEYAAAEFPLTDEGFVEAWAQYAAAAQTRGVHAVLLNALRQLHFPIREGISSEPGYRDVVRRGAVPTHYPLATGLALRAPERMRLRLQPTPGGHIPIIVLGARRDFEDVLRAIVYRNEPVPIPASLGAMMVAGYANWDRIETLRRRLLVTGAALGWPAGRQQMPAHDDLYQDRFIIASQGPYSNVPAAELGLSDHEWRVRSLEIRIHHECAHYFTKRILGSMRNNLLDEIIADYMGIAGSIGRYRADWFLRFMGLDAPDGHREHARLENYRGEPPLSDAAFAILQLLVRRAATALERFDAALSDRASLGTIGRLMLGLTRLTLEELASDEATERLARAMRSH